MLFLGRRRPGQPASQGQPPFNPFLEATELRRRQATAALCVQVCASPHPVAVLGSVGTDGTVGPCPVCRVQHRPFPSSSPVLPPALCVKGPHSHGLQWGLGFLSGAQGQDTNVRAPHNRSPAPSSLGAGLAVRTGLCGPQVASELSLWSWCPQRPSSSSWRPDHQLPLLRLALVSHPP